MSKSKNLDPLISNKFREKGYRLTEPRKAILAVLSRASKHFSIENIYMKVHKNYPEIGLTTIYRTLDLLVRINLVNKFDFGDGKSRYEFIKGQEAEHHHHLICRRCRKIIDYNDFLDEETKLIEKTEKALSSKYDFEIDRHVINFYGLCNQCRSNK